MATTILRVYDNFSNAENARNALLSCGFSSSRVNLNVKEDEAGPVQGNFIVGNTPSFGDAGRTYADDYAEVVQRGAYLLRVDADDDDQASLASRIMDRLGGIDINERTSGWRENRC